MKLKTKNAYNKVFTQQSQLNELIKFIKNPPETSRVIEFTVSMAEYVLTNLNHKNRPRKTSKIVQYARDMSDGMWLLTGETVAFGSDGLLKDGQNRLAACIRSGSSFKTHVAFGIDPMAFAVMDTGANRSHSDVLSIMGIPNAHNVTASLKLYLSWKSGKTNTGQFKITNEELRSYYINNVDDDTIQRAVQMSQKVWKTTGYPVSHVGALYYNACTISKAEEDLITEFFDAMRTGVGGARSPQKILMKHITSLRSNPSYKLTSHDYAVLLTRAWYAYKNKTSLVKADLVVLIADNLPSI